MVSSRPAAPRACELTHSENEERQAAANGDQGAARAARGGARLAERRAVAKAPSGRNGSGKRRFTRAPSNSYGAPKFVERGYYVDTPFRCRGCGKEEIWTAAQQKWWFEVAKGFVHSTAKLCRPCRRREQARRAEARRVHLEGAARKKRKTARPG
ncbi:MAG: zinc-ribbon domain containing protein [Candidatus Binatia bacterium]